MVTEIFDELIKPNIKPVIIINNVAPKLNKNKNCSLDKRKSKRLIPLVIFWRIVLNENSLVIKIITTTARKILKKPARYIRFCQMSGKL